MTSLCNTRVWGNPERTNWIALPQTMDRSLGFEFRDASAAAGLE